MLQAESQHAQRPRGKKRAGACRNKRQVGLEINTLVSFGQIKHLGQCLKDNEKPRKSQKRERWIWVDFRSYSSLILDG